MNKFSEWIKDNDKIQSRIAKKLGIGQSTLHDILKKGLMPSLRLAFAIEDLTNKEVPVDSWRDQMDFMTTKTKSKTRAAKKIKEK